MIRYALKCAEGHSFDSWFQSAAAYDRLAEAGHVTCAVCGGRDVQKSLMAPSVAPDRPPAPAPAPAEGPLSRPASLAEQALRELRRKIETESDYVGDRFAEEARAIHEGAAPERPIHGETRLAEAKKLLEDGIPVAPLPFVPRRSSN